MVDWIWTCSRCGKILQYSDKDRSKIDEHLTSHLSKISESQRQDNIRAFNKKYYPRLEN